MSLKTFTIPFQQLAIMNSLFLTTRISSYHKKNNSNEFVLSYFLQDEKFTLGQIKREDYQTTGIYPIIDQSQDFIAGYSDEDDLVYSGSLPVIVFGDHTRIFKYVDFPFIQGADGIKVLIPNQKIVHPKFFFYLLNQISVPNRGYNRHFSILKNQKYPLIPLATQNDIVAQIKPIEDRIASLRSSIIPAQTIINRVFAREFGFDLEQFEELKKDSMFTIDFSTIGKQNDLRFSAKHSRYSQYLQSLMTKYSFTKFEKLFTTHPQYGANEASKDAESGDIRYIRITDIDDIGNLLDNEVKTAEYVDNKYLLKDNDFLFARSGNTVGKSFLYNSENHPESIFAGYFIKFNFDINKLNPVFMLYYSKSFIFEVWKNTVMRTMGQPNINAEEYKTLPILDIPLSDQSRIVQEIKAELDSQTTITDHIAVERAKIDQIIQQAIT